MPFDAATIDEYSLSDDARLLLEMRRATYRSFAAQLSAAAPDPLPEWAQGLLARWSLEALR